MPLQCRLILNGNSNMTRFSSEKSINTKELMATTCNFNLRCTDDRAAINVAQPICRTFVDDQCLTATQRRDLADGVAGVDDFWAAVDANPYWQQPGQSPLNRCILAALSVRDILHDAGRADAQVLISGVDLRQLDGDNFSLTVGHPSAPRLNGFLNAHMTVRLGDFIIDPTSGQTSRFWNCVPRASAFLICNGGIETIEIAPTSSVRVLALHHYEERGRRYQVGYFRLPRSVRLRARNWRNSPDARPERRRPIVAAARTIRHARLTKGHEAA